MTAPLRVRWAAHPLGLRPPSCPRRIGPKGVRAVGSREGRKMFHWWRAVFACMVCLAIHAGEPQEASARLVETPGSILGDGRSRRTPQSARDKQQRGPWRWIETSNKKDHPKSTRAGVRTADYTAATPRAKGSPRGATAALRVSGVSEFEGNWNRPRLRSLSTVSASPGGSSQLGATPRRDAAEPQRRHDLAVAVGACLSILSVVMGNVGHRASGGGADEGDAELRGAAAVLLRQRVSVSCRPPRWSASRSGVVAVPCCWRLTHWTPGLAGEPRSRRAHYSAACAIRCG